MWDAELGDTPSSATAAKLAATMANAEMQSGYAVPLNYNEAVFLEKPDVSGAQANPWSWGSFYQMQYLNLK